MTNMGENVKNVLRFIMVKTTQNVQSTLVIFLKDQRKTAKLGSLRKLVSSLGYIDKNPIHESWNRHLHILLADLIATSVQMFS